MVPPPAVRAARMYAMVVRDWMVEDDVSGVQLCAIGPCQYAASLCE